METTTLLRLLEWYQNNGINIPVYDQPCNHLENLKGQMQMSSQFSIDLLTHKDHPAEACQSLEDLRETMLAFESCSLKQSAMNLVLQMAILRQNYVCGRSPGQMKIDKDFLCRAKWPAFRSYVESCGLGSYSGLY